MVLQQVIYIQIEDLCLIKIFQKLKTESRQIFFLSYFSRIRINLLNLEAQYFLNTYSFHLVQNLEYLVYLMMQIKQQYTCEKMR
ncbi:unnamed protein product [Paramecium sonneborni]|uniref:Uncharacterized protein n=1 Tax=Paramecium sonneborni TaxID=65129 RepID=A0A8S1PPF2_9CILI|nr:unnamed protein product [Paramecium sonneborni]